MEGATIMKTVLIVDDTNFMRTSLKKILIDNGFEVVGEAENGEIAYKKYMQLCPDIVTMDITMPILDGIEGLKKIKSFDENAKVIMITAMGQEAMVRDAILSGAKGFIVKPFKAETVVSVLSKL